MFIITDTFMTEDQTVSTDVLSVCSTSDEARAKLNELTKNMNGVFVSPDFFSYGEHNSICINFNETSINPDVYVVEYSYDCDSNEAGIVGVYKNFSDAKQALLDDVRGTFGDLFGEDIDNGYYAENDDLINSLGSFNCYDDHCDWSLDDEYHGYYNYYVSTYKQTVR